MRRGSGSRAALQIEIPRQAAGWDAESDDSEPLHAFLEELWDRTSEAATVPHAQAVRDTTVVTLIGDDPDRILALALPFLKRASLPTGTTVTKFPHGRRQALVTF